MSDQLSNLQDAPVGDAFDGFEVFAVGGAVRDALRGVDPSDLDLMAVPRPGEVDDPVGVLGDRMVFVDPESTMPVFRDDHGREVALPRTETDAGLGHDDFELSVVSADTPVNEAVSVDLERRDLTVNAMAFNLRSGELIDPHGGRDDLRDGVVRHVSEAFGDDPLRVVRLARFAPRLGATVAPETVEVARGMSRERLAALPTERVTDELRKVVKQAADAGRFFNVLAHVGALEVTFPVLAEQDTDAVARAVTEARNAVEGDRFGAVMAALGDLLGADADRFAATADLTNQEAATLHVGRNALGDVARMDALGDRAAVDLFDHLSGGRAADPVTFVGAADARFDGVDAVGAIHRVDRLRHVFNAVDGAAVMHDEDVTPGEDMDGEAFGDLLADRRADAL